MKPQSKLRVWAVGGIFALSFLDFFGEGPQRAFGAESTAAAGAAPSSSPSAPLVVETLSSEETAASSRPTLPSEANLVSFDDAVAQILNRSTVIANQQASYDALHAQNLPIRLAFAPSLSFDAKATKTGGIGIDPAYVNRHVEGVAEVNLWRWGADYKNWQAASADEESFRQQVADAYLRTQDNAVAILISHIQRKKEIEVALEIVHMRRASQSIAQQRYNGGYLPMQELNKVDVDRSNAEARLADAEIASIQTSAQLTAQLGHSRIALEWPWRGRFAAPRKSPSIAQTIAIADDVQLAERLSRRPDWQAAQAKVAAEESRTSRNWRSLLPTLDAQLTYGYYYGDLSGPANQPGPFGGSQWQGTLSLQLPFFDRLTLYSRARAQAFIRTQAEVALEQVRRDARAEWETSSQTFTKALKSAQSRDETLVISRKLYQDALQRLRNGRISADDLAIEQSRVYDSELLAVQSWGAVHLAYSRLCKAQGLRLSDCKF